MKIVVMLGIPGSGKGTISGRIAAADAGYRHVSSGSLLRDAVQRKTAVGLEAEEYMQRGELVPDSIMARIVGELASGSGDGATLLLDGFPRTLAQAEMLDTTVAESGATLGLALLLNVPLEDLAERISGRRICPDCGKGYHITNIKPKREGYCDTCEVELITRKDDEAETVRNRMLVYEAETAPLIEFYESRGKLRRVDGSGPIEQTVRFAMGHLKEAGI